MATTEPPIDPSLVPQPGQKYMMWADYLVFSIILLGYIGIGMWQSFGARKPESAKEFMNATGQMPVLPVVLSLMSSVLSAIIILGGSAEIYTQGAMYWLQGIGQWMATIFAGILFVPLLYPLQLTSSYEYLEMRFHSKTVKLCGTLFLVVGQLFYMGVCIYSPATALEAVTGFPETASIVIGSVVAGVYSILGGLKGSIWVGAVQALLMLFGTLVAIIKPCIDHPDGIAGLWKINEQTERLDMWNFDPSPLNRHTFWTLVIGNWISWMNTYGPNQASVQRYCSVSSMKKGMLVVFLNGPGLMIVTTLCAMSGGTIFGWYYYVGCDPLAAGYLSNSNQVLPYYIMDRMDIPCIPGLFMAGLFAGALSSISGALGALSSVTWQDLFEWKYHYLSERAKTIIQKIIMALFSVAGIGIAFMVRQFGGTVLQLSLSLTGAAGGPMLGLFLLGGLFPCAEWIGATVGSLVGLAYALWLVIGSYSAGIAAYPLPTTTENCVNYTEPLANATDLYLPHEVEGWEQMYLLSYLYFAAIGMAITLFLGLIISFFAGCTNPKEAEPTLHMPLADRLFCCVRDKTLDALRYGWSRDDLIPHIGEEQSDRSSLVSSLSSGSSLTKRKPYDSYTADKAIHAYDNKGADMSYAHTDTDVALGKMRIRTDHPPAYNGVKKADGVGVSHSTIPASIFHGMPPDMIRESTAF